MVYSYIVTYMHITWHGDYTVKLVVGDKTIIIDPNTSFRGKADVVALSDPSNPALSNLKSIQGDPLIIDTPGEYSILGCTLYALGWIDKNEAEHSVQRWEAEKMILLFLGSLDRPLSDAELQELERTNVDILFLPVGGERLKIKQAMDILTTIEPRIVIPVGFTDIKPFADEMGVSPKNKQSKYLAKANKLPSDDLEIIILEQ